CPALSRFIFSAAMKLFSNSSFIQDPPIPPLGIWNLELGVCQCSRPAKSRPVSLNKCEGGLASFRSRVFLEFEAWKPGFSPFCPVQSNLLQPNPTKKPGGGTIPNLQLDTSVQQY